jgi:hypothetical protein
MNTFIEGHGYQRWMKNNPQKFPRIGQCEITGCELRKTIKEILYSRNQPEMKFRRDIEFLEFLISEENGLDQVARLLRRENGKRQPALLFDHCHIHGWIRGLVCNSCNTLLGQIDRGERDKQWEDGKEFRPLGKGIWNGEEYIFEKMIQLPKPRYAEHLLKCPDCFDQTQCVDHVGIPFALEDSDTVDDDDADYEYGDYEYEDICEIDDDGWLLIGHDVNSGY